MKTSWWVRFSVLVILVVLSIATIIPTALNLDEKSSFPMKSKINLGLDLQGGLYMIMGIDFKKVYRDEVQTHVRKIESLLKDQEIPMTIGALDTSDPLDPKQSFSLSKVSDAEAAKKRIKEYFGSNTIRITMEQGEKFQIALSAPIKSQIEEQSVGKSIEVIRNRIDEFGVTEPEITAQGNDRIVVQLPGVRDIERAKELIGKTAKLEFKIVNDTIPPTQLMSWIDKAKAAGIEYKKGERFSDYLQKLNNHVRAELPENHEIAFEKPNSANVNETAPTIPYLIEATPRITGDDLSDAIVQIDPQNNMPYVSMDFKTQGAKRFEETTGNNIGKRMAVVLDGNVYSAPVIQGKIGGGRAQITLGQGDFNKTMSEARDLALVLRAGALPVQLDFLEQRTVGPNLGQDAIAKARYASIIGCVLVFLFAMFYYRFSGVIAVVTLILNVLFTMAVLISMDATLTLPGIAGIALTVGMAVDGNIIIMEKIRDEVRNGISNIRAVQLGFDSAFWTLLDANITSAAAGFCLLNFGTGPIRGFAVTLLIGLAVTLYTAYAVSKILFELYMDKNGGKSLSI